MRYWFVIAIAALSCVATNSVFAWGPHGHEVSGAIADQLLTPSAKKKLQEIAGISLRSASKWADCVKDVSPKDGVFKYQPNPKYSAACKELEATVGIARMEEYVARNSDGCGNSSATELCHKQYHYADVAIQHDKYDRSYAGTNDHDIVSAINAAIAVLQGKPAPAPLSIKDQKEALLMLAHFMGDLHQPLHVGAVYIDAFGQPMNPDLLGEKLDHRTETRGGNSIAVGSSNLHAQWDAIPTSIKSATISDAMLKEARSVAKVTGPIGKWPGAWASETVVVAQGAFEGITYNDDPAKKPGWVAEFKDRKAYLKHRNKAQREQLAKAGARLAMVLNEVWK